MQTLLRVTAALIGLGWAAVAAPAHFSMLLPESASARREEAMVVVYQWGHPFEHQLFDAPAPESAFAVTPDGKRIDLTRELEKLTTPAAGQKGAVAYRLRFTPERRGDYLIVLNTPPMWMEDEELFLQDSVKVVLHVQTQKGWDTTAGQAFEVLPLTRPYGLQPGMAFQAQILAEGKPAAGVLVEVERYNATAPKELPPDEHVTRAAKTDPNGVVICTLTEPGWWCITARREAGQRTRAGKTFPLRQRSTLWVFVDEKATAQGTTRPDR